jgi:hypothetical protein
MSISMILTQYTVPTPTNLKDYVPVAQLLSSPGLLTVNSKASWNSLKEILDYAKANPGKVKFSSSGTGTSDYIFAAGFQRPPASNFSMSPMRETLLRLPPLQEAMWIATLLRWWLSKPLWMRGHESIGRGLRQRRPLYRRSYMEGAGVNISISSFEGIYAPKELPAGIVATLEKALERL